MIPIIEDEKLVEVMPSFLLKKTKKVQNTIAALRIEGSEGIGGF